MEIVEVVSDGRSAAAPARSGAPQFEQKRLFSALRLPHLVHTRADIDGSSCRGCPAGALDAYGSEANPPPVPGGWRFPETYAARLGRVNRRRALTSGNVTSRTSDLVPEQRTLTVLPLRFRRLHAMAGGRVVAALSRALAEQLRKQLHGRFPLTETDPPVGQDEP